MTEETEARLREELAKTRADLRAARARILAMEASAFWKLRNAWWKVKTRITGRSEPGLWAPLPPDDAAEPGGPAPSAAADVFFASDADPGPELDALIRFTLPPSSLGILSEHPSPSLARFAKEQGLSVSSDGVPGDAPFVALVSPGTLVTKDWVDPLVRALAEDRGIDAAVPWSEATAPPFAREWARWMGAGGAIHARLGEVAPPPAALVRRAALAGGTAAGAVARAAASGRLALVEESLVLAGVPRRLPDGDRRIRGLTRHRASAERRTAAVAEGARRFEGLRILFVLPVADRGGGANVVISEARAMAAMGVDARVLNTTSLRPFFDRSYPEPGLPVLDAPPEKIPAAAERFEAVVATANPSVSWIAPLAGRGPVLGYYVQDFEPLFYEKGSGAYRQALASYTLVPGLRLFTKTGWNRDVVLRETGADAHVIGPSFDVDLFRPRRPAPPASPVRVAAMVRPASPRRAAAFTLRVLAGVQRAAGSAVEILTFGVEADDRQYRALARDFPHRHLGVLGEGELADLLGSVHVLADFSEYQAMGLTALEAMGSGATAIVPEAGGAASFATHRENALFADTRSEERCRDSVLELVGDPALRDRLMEAAPEVGSRFSPEESALAILRSLFPDA